MVNKIILAGFIIRIICSIFLFHPDIKSQYFHAQFLSKGVNDIYTYIDTHKSELPYKDTFNYPPLTYLLLGSWYPVADILSGHQINYWVNDWSVHAQNTPYLFANLVLLKFPYFIADLLLLFLLLKVFKKNSSTLSFVWAFNPVLLYGIYAVGQFDIIPALCVLTSLILFTKNKSILAGLVLAIASGIKGYPVILLPTLLLSQSSIKLKVKFILSFILSTIIIFLPFANNSSYLHSQVNAGLITRLLEIKIFNIPTVIPLLLFGLIISYYKYHNSNKYLFISGLVSLLLVLSSIKFHAQWGVWIIPLLLPFLSSSKKIICSFLIWTLLFFIYIFSLPDNYVLLGLLSPISNYLAYTPSIISHFPSLLDKTSYFRILFFTGTLVLVTTLIFTSYKKINLRISKYSVILAIGICMLIFGLALLSSIFLVKRVNEISQFTVNRFVPITPEKPITQTFKINNPGLSEIVVFLRNPQIKNSDPLTLELQDSNKNSLRQLTISGKNIGDGVDVPFKFPPVKTNQKMYQLTIKVPRLVEQPQRIEAGFSNEDTYADGSSVEPGDLSFQTFYTPTSKVSMVESIIKNITRNLVSVQLLAGLLIWSLGLKCALVSFRTGRDI